MGRRFKVGLALGGGGVRGLAHIGILRAFERAGVPIDIIVGTSMGAVIGGAYAISGHSFSVEQKVLELLQKSEIAQLEALAADSRPEEKKMIIEGLVSFVKELLLWNLRGVKLGIADGRAIKALVKELIEDADFSQAKIAFGCIASDIRTGEEVIMNSGKMIEAIMASSSIPGVFAPVRREGRLLVDGYITSEVPVEAARQLGATFVIAVNVEEKIFHDKFQHGMDILFQADEIKSHELLKLKLKLADFVISPRVEDLSWAAFSQAAYSIQKGEEAALQALPLLKSKLARRRRLYFFKRLFFR